MSREGGFGGVLRCVDAACSGNGVSGMGMVGLWVWAVLFSERAGFDVDDVSLYE